jgi:hypothetical protein
VNYLNGANHEFKLDFKVIVVTNLGEHIETAHSEEYVNVLLLVRTFRFIF